MTISTEHIEVTTGICGGKPRIAGTRIRVQDIVVWHNQAGRSFEQIIAEFPQLSLADVYAAMTYYHDHRQEIDRFIEQDQAAYEELKRSQPSLVEKLQRRRDASGTADSSR